MAQVSAGSTFLGAAANNNGTMYVKGVENGQHSTLNLTSQMNIGSGAGATGNLYVQAGGIVNCTGGYLGSLGAPSQNYNGNAFIDGSGSQWNVLATSSTNGNVTMGNTSGLYYGDLYITDGAAVNVGGTVKVGGTSIYYNGQISFGNGGTLTCKGITMASSSILSSSGPVPARSIPAESCATPV